MADLLFLHFVTWTISFVAVRTFHLLGWKIISLRQTRARRKHVLSSMAAQPLMLGSEFQSNIQLCVLVRLRRTLIPRTKNPSQDEQRKEMPFEGWNEPGLYLSNLAARSLLRIPSSQREWRVLRRRSQADRERLRKPGTKTVLRLSLVA